MVDNRSGCKKMYQYAQNIAFLFIYVTFVKLVPHPALPPAFGQMFQ